MEKAVCIIAILFISIWSLGCAESTFEKVIEYRNEHEKTCDINGISAQTCDKVIEQNIAKPETVCLVRDYDKEEYFVCDNGIWRPFGWVTDHKQSHRQKRFFFFFIAAAVATAVVCTVLCGGGSSNSPAVEPNTPPVITCPEISTNFVCLIRESDVIITWPDATATDKEDGNDVVVKQIYGSPSGSRFSQGETIMYEAEDSHGNTAKCSFVFKVTVITCTPLDWPKNGRQSCDLSNNIYGTICTFTCDPGFDLQGQTTSVCQSDGTYTYQPPNCVPQICGEPPPPDNGQAVCSDSSYAFSSSCYATCNSSYSLEEYTVIECMANKTWSSTLPRCLDSEPPVKQFCPNTILVYNDRGTDTANVTWAEPIFTDNVGPVIINQIMGIPSGSLFRVGGTEIRYEAKDGQGNTSPKCTFFVIVEALTCQQNLQDNKLRYNCPNDNFNYGSTCELSCDGNYPLVGNDTITCERNDTVDSVETYWSWGETNIEPYCQEITCPSINPPQNGGLVCNTVEANEVCVMTCNAQFDFPIGTTVNEMYVCSNSGTWFPALPVPGCTALRVPIFSILPGELYYFTGNCTDEATQNAIKENFEQIFQSDKLSQFCPTSGCSIASVEVTCGPTGGRRKRRVKRGIDIKYVNTIQLPQAVKGRRKRNTQTSHEIKLSYDMKMNFESNFTDYFYIHNLMKEFENATIKQAINSGQLNIGNMSVSRSTIGWTNFQCAEGQNFRFGTFSCASCPTGSYFNNTVNDCVKCPVGMYQDEDGSLECKQCPQDTSTVENGTRNSSLCLEICPEGSFSKTGLSPCFKCPSGKYQEYKQSTSCENCQNMLTTLTSGSSKADACTGFDVVLKNVNTTINIRIPTNNLTVTFWMLDKDDNGEKPLQPITSNTQNTLLIDFSTFTSFKNNGVVTDVSQVEKQTKWNHIVIQVHTDTGNLSVFLNGQIVFSNDTSLIGVTELQLSVQDIQISRYQVYPHILSGADILALSESCSANISTSSIQTIVDIKSLPGAEVVVPSTCNAINPCKDNPCNGHICQITFNGFECRCKDGFSGVTCNNPPDYCANHNCKNGATCVGQNGTYTCVCSAGFKGTFCENAIVNGNWNNWQQWSECTKTCGGGVRSRNRTCNNPPPDDEGIFCVGSDMYVQPCNTDSCPECQSFTTKRNYGNVFTCNNVNGYNICNVTCKNGLVFPNGNYHEYHCGKNTSYEWQQEPPSCMEPNSPALMALRAESSINSFPCSGEEEAKTTYQERINQLLCRRSGTCSLDISTEGCKQNMRRKRSTSTLSIIVTLSIQLVNQPLDLVALYDNNTVSPALTSFINAYNDLETTAQQISNSSSTIFAVNINGVTYNVDGNAIDLQPIITCGAGTVLQDGVCAQCPYGTRYLYGICMYCDKGTYQNLTGQTECTACPYGYTTKFKGSTSILDCGVQESTTSIVTTYSTTNKHPKDKKESKKPLKTEIIIGVIVACLLCAVIIGIIIRCLTRKTPKRRLSVASLGKIHPELEENLQSDGKKIPLPPSKISLSEDDMPDNTIDSNLEQYSCQNEDIRPPLQHKLLLAWELSENKQ